MLIVKRFQWAWLSYCVDHDWLSPGNLLQTTSFDGYFPFGNLPSILLLSAPVFVSCVFFFLRVLKFSLVC